MSRTKSLRNGLLLLQLAATGSAFAHQAPSGWEYGRECCSNRDCAQVAAPRITPEGMLFHLPVGAHPATAREALTLLVPHRDRAIHPSGDEFWHLCIHPELRVFYCVYMPVGGV